MTTKPSIVCAIPSHEVDQETSFSISIRKAFLPQDGSLRYLFTSYAPDWITINNKLGIISGIAPKVSYNKPYKFTVVVSNDLGVVTQSFILKVQCTDLFESMARTLTLDLTKEKYGASRVLPLLQYVYEYYNQLESQKRFIRSINEAAEETNIAPPKKLDYDSFRDFMLHINPDIEKHLRDRLIERVGANALLLTVTLTQNDIHLRNLYRQGSQPAGVIPIPIWNHLNAPNLYNWPNWNPIDNVLDAASDAVAELVKKNRLKKQHAKKTYHRSMFQPKPIPHG